MLSQFFFPPFQDSVPRIDTAWSVELKHCLSLCCLTREPTCEALETYIHTGSLRVKTGQEKEREKKQQPLVLLSSHAQKNTMGTYLLLLLLLLPTWI